jgi:hypothetical protein
MVDTFLDDMEGMVVNLPTLPSAITDWMDRLGRFRGLVDVIVAKPASFINEILIWSAVSMSP